ncbi:hypothetical protein TTHERM_00263100 (macronuclear) [Tetrahymena thermophila SB210]|uniref:Uncharacterized protein n=1 Tax=Tetrahymena thermophila (strain SB210) TaxID=312017 RepID=Q22U73_TETTS|nr:hypothetical protein TTHERM_00263100 [Tetrahymena thermophila SB210]EAR88814.1 hypothetical protein TTHERM_00263100 [Tetrahymena thermophila SB210]|eukprot:XP_001009059.1 hypothetical protein TTHERM_00263100 [Tetrahymena thermophila SB210]
METQNFGLTQYASYLNGISHLTSSYNCQSPKGENVAKLSENNPFFNDPLINSLLSKYNHVSQQGDSSIRNPEISSISTQLSPKSNYSPIIFGQKQIQFQQSPLDTSQTKYSDILSEQASNQIFNSYYLTDAQYANSSPQKDAEKYKEEMQQLNKEILRLKSANNELTLQNEQLNQRVKQSEVQHNLDQQSILKYENAILVLDQKVNQLELNLKQKNEEILNLQVSKQIAIEQEQTKLNAAFQMEKLALNQEILNLKNSIMKKIQMNNPDHEMHTNLYIDQSTEKDKEIQRLKQEYEELKIENNILKDELIKRIEFQNESKDISKMHEMLSQKNQEIDQLQKSILIIHSQLEISQSQTQLNKSQVNAEIRESLQEQLTEQQEMLLDQEQTIELLRSSLDNLNEKCKYQEEELSKCTKERDELREKYDQMKEDNLVLRISVSCKEKEYQELAQQMQQSQNNKQNVVQRKILTGSLDLRDLLK